MLVVVQSALVLLQYIQYIRWQLQYDADAVYIQYRWQSDFTVVLWVG